MVFQSGAALSTRSTVGENVRFRSQISRAYQSRTSTSTVMKSRACWEVDDVLDKLPSELSTGMKPPWPSVARVAQNPEAILFDEPDDHGRPGSMVGSHGRVDSAS